jgi:competence protein ComEC
MNEKKLKISIKVIFYLVILNLVLVGYFFFLNQNSKIDLNDKYLKIIFLDVGQGDSILIQTPVAYNILIDGGPNSNLVYKLDKYVPINNRKIDLMILTHPDPDHLIGLIEVLKRYKVNYVAYTGVSDPDLAYLEWKKLIKEKQIPTIIIDKKKNLKLDEKINLEFLWPQENLVNKSFDDDNYNSIVCKLIFDQIKFLFTADIPKEVEEKLIELKEDLEADVLKVAHHGSKDSTSLEFLNFVKPKYAVISVGRNKFGHPNFRVLSNLKKIRANILRTDFLKDIIFITDGKELKLIKI